MQLYGLIILNEFAAAHPECLGPVAAWRLEVEEASWTTPQQVQARYITAQIAKGGRVVFGLLRGVYMLGTKVKYDRGIVLVERAWVDGQPAKAATRSSKK
jgi:mRNA interferase HigB